jgi:hypothetical protein
VSVEHFVELLIDIASFAAVFAIPVGAVDVLLTLRARRSRT